MLRDATAARNSVDTPVEAMSRRALLTASAGLLGAATLAPDVALAQAPAAPPTMPASQAPVRNDWLAKHTEDILESGLLIIDPHHVGGPVAIGPYAGKRDEAFAAWRAKIQEVASFPSGDRSSQCVIHLGVDPQASRHARQEASRA